MGDGDCSSVLQFGAGLNDLKKHRFKNFRNLHDLNCSFLKRQLSYSKDIIKKTIVH